MSSIGESLNDSVQRAIIDHRVIPVVRRDDSGTCADVAMRMLAAGLTLVEIAATTPQWQDALAKVRDAYPSLTVGVGTVMNASMADEAVSLGADFLVSPSINDDLRRSHGRVLIEGGFSPTEVLRASEYGLAKLFPAHVGGPRLLGSLLAVFPDRLIMPTGGLSLEEAPSYFAAGAVAVGIGSGLDGLADPAAAIKAATVPSYP